MYLFYTVVACMFASVFEMILINDVRPALARAAFTLLQGTWFYQVVHHAFSGLPYVHVAYYVSY